jgi:hypothetical protein
VLRVVLGGAAGLLLFGVPKRATAAAVAAGTPEIRQVAPLP